METGTATTIVNQKTKGTETLLGLAASTSLAVMIVIFSTGHILGAHLNQFVTISFAALKHFPWKQVPMYIGAQVMASLSVACALKAIFHPFLAGGVIVPYVSNLCFGFHHIVQPHVCYYSCGHQHSSCRRAGWNCYWSHCHA